MSVGQLTATHLIGPPTPKLRVASNMPTPNRFTAMCWARHTGGTADAYQDLIAISDDNEVIGLGTHVVGGNRRMLLGDLNSDNDGPTNIPDNQWDHYCLTVDDVAGTGTRCYGYLNGRHHIGPVSLVSPPTATFFALFNSRSSDTDAGAVWIGYMAGVKIYTDVPLSPEEVEREMWFYTPQRWANLWGWSPLQGVDHRSLILGGLAGQDWATQSNLWVDGPDPPGVVWDTPLVVRTARRRMAIVGPITPAHAAAAAVAVAPTVVLGAVSITPAVAAAAAVAIAPTVLTPVTVTPAAAAAASVAVAPSVVLGSVSIMPAAGEAAAVAVAPSVVLGALSITPAAAEAASSAIAPTVQLGGATITPAAATGQAVAIAPTVSAGGISVTPAAAIAVASAVAPAVVLGGVSVTPAASVAQTVAVAPTVALGAISITPAAAISAAAAVAPTVVLASITPAAAETAAVAIAPSVILGPVTVTPLAAIVAAACVAPSVSTGAVAAGGPLCLIAAGSFHAGAIAAGAFLPPVETGAYLAGGVAAGACQCN